MQVRAVGQDGVKDVLPFGISCHLVCACRYEGFHGIIALEFECQLKRRVTSRIFLVNVLRKRPNQKIESWVGTILVRLRHHCKMNKALVSSQPVFESILQPAFAFTKSCDALVAAMRLCELDISAQRSIAEKIL